MYTIVICYAGLPLAHASQWHQRNQRGLFQDCGDDHPDLLPQEPPSSYEDLSISGKERNKRSCPPMHTSMYMYIMLNCYLVTIQASTPVKFLMITKIQKPPSLYVIVPGKNRIFFYYEFRLRYRV